MKKKLMALLLTAALLFTLTGCGGGNDQTAEKPAEQEQQAAEKPAATEPPAEEAVADIADPVEEATDEPAQQEETAAAAAQPEEDDVPDDPAHIIARYYNTGDSCYGVRKNGTLVFAAARIYEDERQAVEKATGIASMTGYYCLREDGTVTVLDGDEYYEKIFAGWTDIVALSAGYYGVIGLRKDGTVLQYGYESSSGKADVSGWTDVVAIGAGTYHVVGLRKDGTVLAAATSRSAPGTNVSRWSDIVSIAVGRDHTVGLKKDGTVVATGDNYRGACNVGDWTDITAIKADYCTVGLRSDGTVAVAGLNNEDDINEIAGWTDIVDVYTFLDCVVGLKKDGTVVMVGGVGSEDQSKQTVSGWTDVVAISVNGGIAALKSDGTVLLAGYGITDEIQNEVNSWNLLQ